MDKYDKEIKLFRSDDENINVAAQFLNSLLKEADEIKTIMSKVVPMNLTEDEEVQFQLADTCHLCSNPFLSKEELKLKLKNSGKKNFGKRLQEMIKGEVKARDHDHLTGKYRGAAHARCNIQYGWKKYKIPVIFHNLRGYDSHFIIKALTEKFKKVHCIPTSSEKFVSFSINNLVFIDNVFHSSFFRISCF